VYGGRADARPDAAAAPAVSVSRTARWLALMIGLGCLALLVAAASIEPSPAGTGSHTGLGLQRCQFLDRTGVPCLSCGYTTSFTWFVRGNLLASVYVQPMGALIAAATACGVWICFYVAMTGRPVHRLLRLIPTRRWLLPLLLFVVAAWGWKIYIHVNGMDGWGRP
jgi:Protein of unknown function (DUF2752)